MFRTFSANGPGGQIPRCYAFRLRPRLLAGKAAGTGPWPVIIRHTGTERRGDTPVFDTSPKSSLEVRADGAPPLGPYIIDPGGLLPSWGWDVECVDERTERLEAGAEGVDPGLGGALRVASRGGLLWDSGVVAAGAVIASPVLDVAGASGLAVIVRNDDGAATRNLFMGLYLDDGATLIYPLTGAIGGAGPNTYKVTAIGPGSAVGAGGSVIPGYAVPMILPAFVSFSLTAAGASNGRLTIFRR